MLIFLFALHSQSANGRSALAVLNRCDMLSLGFLRWLIRNQAKQVAEKDHDSNLSDCRHVNGRLLLDFRAEVL